MNQSNGHSGGNNMGQHRLLDIVAYVFTPQDQGSVLSRLSALPDLIQRAANERSEAKLHRALDNSPTVIFNAATQTSQQGYSVLQFNAASLAALNGASKPGIALLYADRDACADRHFDFVAGEQVGVRSVPITDKISIPKRIIETSYRPKIVAYQADAADMSRACVLYAGARPGLAVRRDGREFQL